MKKYKSIGYVRGGDKFSTEEQEELIRKYGVMFKCEILKVFKDEGMSANNFNRPGLQEMFHYIETENPEIKHLVVVSMDRLVRNVGKLGSLRKFLRKRGIVITSLSRSILKSAASMQKGSF